MMYIVSKTCLISSAVRQAALAVAVGSQGL